MHHAQKKAQNKCNEHTTHHHVISAGIEPCRRSHHRVPPWEFSSHQSANQQMYHRPKDGTHEAPYGASFEVGGVIICASNSASPSHHLHQRYGTTMIGIILPTIGIYHRMYHRPNDGSHEASSSIFNHRIYRSTDGDDCLGVVQPHRRRLKCTTRKDGA